MMNSTRSSRTSKQSPDLLSKVAETLGGALGRIVAKSRPASKPAKASARRKRKPSRRAKNGKQI
jgi:hypothetical protein